MRDSTLPERRFGDTWTERYAFRAAAPLTLLTLGVHTPWRDVYADVKVNRALHIQAGRFKVPFSLEQLTSGTELDFIARAAAVSDLSPSRDIGVMVHGRLADRMVKYEAGVFEVANTLDYLPTSPRDTWTHCPE